jgi:hypothetical protein
MKKRSRSNSDTPSFNIHIGDITLKAFSLIKGKHGFSAGDSVVLQKTNGSSSSLAYFKHESSNREFAKLRIGSREIKN